VDTWTKFLSTKKHPYNDCNIVIIITKNLRQMKHGKLINVIINSRFQTLHLKKSNSDVSVTDAFRGCCDSVKLAIRIVGVLLCA
jgi:hypothetical protein